MPGEACLPQAGISLPRLSSPCASKTTNFYSVQMNRSPILQLTRNKPLHFSYAMQMNAFPAPSGLQFAQNKSLHHEPVHFFYSIQMSGHKRTAVLAVVAHTCPPVLPAC
jgi:hypothetical protein